MSRSVVRGMVVVLGVIMAVVARGEIMVDNFEQNNTNLNTLGFWSGVYVSNPTNACGYLPDLVGAQKNGANGAALWYSNNVAGTILFNFYTPISTNSPYVDLSGAAHYLRFWIKAAGGTPAIQHVTLEGSSYTNYGRVPFANYNDGSGRVLGDWREISVPLVDFLGDVGGNFSLSHVGSVSLSFNPTSSIGQISTVVMDDLRIADTPPPAPLVVTNNVFVDTFEQNNDRLNSLSLWSSLWLDTTASAGDLIADVIGAGRSGSRGGIVWYSNYVDGAWCQFYTVVADGWPYASLAGGGVHVRFWIKGAGGAPAIDRVILETGDRTRYGQVAFSNYNAGRSAVRGDWHEVSIPAADFLADHSAGFSLANVSAVGLRFAGAPATGSACSVVLDDLLLATNPAPLWAGQAVTNTLVIDNFEQNNERPNTLGWWSDFYCAPSNVGGGFLWDFAGVQKNGARGGVVYYSNSVPAAFDCQFYTLLTTNWPYCDLRAPGLHLRFWVRQSDGTPGIDKLVLKNGEAGSAEVPFSAYNKGSVLVDRDWYEVSVPMTDFLARTTGDFDLSRVSVLSLQMAATTSVGRTSAIWLDDIQIATSPAPVIPSIVVTQAVVIDNFEQVNAEFNTLGYWSSVWYQEADGGCGFMGDQTAAAWYGARGGTVWFMNGPARNTNCVWYSVLATNVPYYDLTATDLYVRFWIRSDGGTSQLDTVYLQGPDNTRYGRVRFADYNGGSSRVAAEWSEISIPASDFLHEVGGTFSLSKVAVLGLRPKLDANGTYVSTVQLDEIQISPQPSSPPVKGAAVTADLLVDDFEQDNGNNNTLGLWSTLYVATPGTAGFLSDWAGAQWNGSRGGVVYYEESWPPTNQFTFYSVLATDWPHRDLGATSLYVRFWVKANEGTPAISRVFLQGRDYLQTAEVDFAPYNGGTNRLSAGWREVSIPVSDFLVRTSGSFSVHRVGTLGFRLASNSTVGATSSLYLDDLQLSTSPAPVPVPAILVTNLLVVDDFEQTNAEPNSVGGWANVSFNASLSSAGFIPDFAGVQHNGAYGGVVWYSCSAGLAVAPVFYTVLSDTWPHADLSRPGLALQFWIRAAEGAPVLSRVDLQGENDRLFGRVSFANYNGGQAQVGSEWRLISVPVGDFLADAGGGFTPDRVKSIAFAFDPSSSVGSSSAIWLDGIRVIDAQDTDGDTEPDAADSDDDNDGMPDTWEESYFSGATNAPPDGDADQDGSPNLDECVADTNPQNSNSVFVIERLVCQATVNVLFDSSSNRVYDLLCCTNLMTGSWAVRATNVRGDGGEVQLTDPIPTGFGAYRLRVKMP